ncbi:MAG: hypothetical protein ACO1N0_12910 [Fluviicola sp.]
MKNLCLFLILTSFAFTTKASDHRKALIPFLMYNTTKNTAIKPGEATITLHFNGANLKNRYFGYQTIIYYSVNEVEDTLVFDSLFTTTLQLPAGKTVFKFWPGPGYNEVITDSIQIQDQTDNEANVNFISDSEQIYVFKPVIYLQSPVKLNFSIRVKPTDGFTFTYPVYKDLWEGTLDPTGEIEINQQKYPYLFWDAKQKFTAKSHTNGYHIQKKEVVPFLEEQLSTAGLTSTEKTDFITFWGPRLTQYESVFIQFYLQEDCNQFASLECEPKPTAINRLYIAFSEWNDKLEPFTHQAQLPAFKREGFNVLEWGGFELTSIEL